MPSSTPQDVNDGGVSALLAGPRGRRLCLEWAAAWEPRMWTAVLTASRRFEPADGASYRPLTTGAWNEPEPPAVPREDPVTIEQVATLLAEVDLGGLTDSALHEALTQSVDWARYWQEPDGTDVLATHPLIRSALGPLAGQIVGSPLARTWSAPRGTEQWAIDWRSPDDPAPLHRAPRETLAQWTTDTQEEEARAALERPRDPAANWGGTWWSIPLQLLRTVGHVPAGLDLVEDSLGYEEATAIPVRGIGRTYEIRTEHDWILLCQSYPMEITASRRHDWYRTTGRDGRWVIPDWERVAADWDAVHLTTLGYLGAATRALPVDGDTATVLAGFDPDTTLWLTDVAREVAGDPDDARQHWRRRESGDNSGAWERVG